MDASTFAARQGAGAEATLTRTQDAKEDRERTQPPAGAVPKQ